MKSSTAALRSVLTAICAAVCLSAADIGQDRVDLESRAAKELREAVGSGCLYVHGFVSQQSGLSEFPLIDQAEALPLLEEFSVSRRLRSISDISPSSQEAKRWDDEQRRYCAEFNKLVLAHLRDRKEKAAQPGATDNPGYAQ
jgi:hypothetical protein